MYEVEMKFPIKDDESIKKKLVHVAARFGDPISQIDYYFAHPVRDFSKTDEALRLRKSGQKVVMTWKGPRVDSSTKTRREIELPLGDHGLPSHQTILDWTDMLVSLGFQKVFEVEKKRQPVRVHWRGSEIDVALDHVKNLGHFMELELQAGKEEVVQAQDAIRSLAKELGYFEDEKRSYLELLLSQQPTNNTDG